MDTSVWTAALRIHGDAAVASELARLVASGEAEARVHPWVLGELVLGGLSSRALQSLSAQTGAPVVPPGDQLAFVDAHAAWGARVGWVDTQLLACASVSGWSLWTLDRALADAAGRLGCAHASAG